MDMTIRAMKPDERNYSYTQEKSVQKNTGWEWSSSKSMLKCGFMR